MIKVMLSQHIEALQALLEQHGDIQVVKSDMECGIETDLQLKVTKVFEDQPGWLTSYDDETIEERRRTAAEVHTDDQLLEWYTELKASMADSGFPFEQTYEDYKAQCMAVAPGAAETVRKYDEAPFMLVI